LSLPDALFLVARRAQLIHELPGGKMLAIPLSEEGVRPLLNDKLELSAINGPSLCVVSGPTAEVAELEGYLSQRALAYRRLQTCHAFHSSMMKPIVGRFSELFESVSLKPPQIPYLSNVTGTWIKSEEATDPGYWARHLCQEIRLYDGLKELLKEPGRSLVE